MNKQFLLDYAMVLTKLAISLIMLYAITCSVNAILTNYFQLKAAVIKIKAERSK